MDEIKVTVSSYGPGRNLVMRYTDPVTGKRVARSAKTKDEREAERVAAVWQDELNSGRYIPISKMTWSEFRKRFEAERLAAMPTTSQRAYSGALNVFERLLNPDRLAKVTPQAMSRFQAAARGEGMKDTTLARNLRHIRAALRWGERQGLIRKAPTIDMPKLGGGNLGKHRPITAEEYDRLVAAIHKTRKTDAPQFERLLKGLWLSGLRLSEALTLMWDDGPFVLDTSGKHPRFAIQASGQKSRRSELCPITPDFGAWILGATPEPQRVGRVFPVFTRDNRPMPQQQVSRLIAKAGRKAGIIVGESERVTKDAGRLVKTPVKLTATAHDLRRAFCTRWAKKVMPPVLKTLARHANISTTMGYYVSMTADDVAADLWAKHGEGTEPGRIGNTTGNTRGEKAVFLGGKQ